MKKIILLFIVSLVALIASCSLGPPNPGFTLVLTRIDEFGFERPLPGIDTTGRLIAAADNASGSIANFHDVSGVSGQIPVPNGRAPGLWALTENNGPCGGQTKNGDIQRGYSIIYPAFVEPFLLTLVHLQLMRMRRQPPLTLQALA